MATAPLYDIARRLYGHVAVMPWRDPVPGRVHWNEADLHALVTAAASYDSTAAMLVDTAITGLTRLERIQAGDLGQDHVLDTVREEYGRMHRATLQALEGLIELASGP